MKLKTLGMFIMLVYKKHGLRCDRSGSSSELQMPASRSSHAWRPPFPSVFTISSLLRKHKNII